MIRAEDIGPFETEGNETEEETPFPPLTNPAPAEPDRREPVPA
jgi:hypothetical protein